MENRYTGFAQTQLNGRRLERLLNIFAGKLPFKSLATVEKPSRLGDGAWHGAVPSPRILGPARPPVL